MQQPQQQTPLMRQVEDGMMNRVQQQRGDVHGQLGSGTATSSRHHEGREGARCCPRGGARKPRARRRASMFRLSNAANESS